MTSAERRMDLMEELTALRQERRRLTAAVDARQILLSEDWMRIRGVLCEELRDLPDVRIRIAERLAALAQLDVEDVQI